MAARDETWQVVMPADDLWEGELTGVRLGAKDIVLLNAGGEIRAFEDRGLRGPLSPPGFPTQPGRP
jgi:hypothetical protein